MATQISFNDALADNFTRHAVDLARFEAGTRRRVLSMLKQLEQELVGRLATRDLTEYQTGRLEALLKQTRETIATGYKGIRKAVNDDFQSFGKLESEWILKTINAEAGIELASVAVAPEVMRAAVSTAMIDGQPQSEWWARQSLRTQDLFSKQMRLGVMSGETTDQIVRRVRDVFENLTRANVTSLVRTGLTSVSTAARLETYEANDDVIDAVQQRSILDSRTTTICRAYSGLAWSLPDYEPIDHKLPFGSGTPRHFNALASGSMIKTAHGEKAIEDIRPGELVWTHRGRLRRVYAVMSKSNKSGVIRRLNMESGRTLLATDEHPILSLVPRLCRFIGSNRRFDGWKRADQLQAGDKFFQYPENLMESRRSVAPRTVPIGKANDYPSPFGEIFVPDKVFCLSRASSMLTGIEFKSHPRIGESKVCNVASNRKLELRRSQITKQNFLALGGFASIDVGHLNRQPFEVSISSPRIERFPVAAAGLRLRFNRKSEISHVPTQSVKCAPDKFRGSIRTSPSLFENLFDFRARQVEFDSATAVSTPAYWHLCTLTSIEIINYSGTVWNLAVEEDETYIAEGVIVHNCRSAIIPIVKAFSDMKALKTGGRSARADAYFRRRLREQGMEQDAIDRAVRNAQASMDGQVPTDWNYETWLKTKPASFQQQVLGPTKYRLWSRGKLNFTELVDEAGRPLTVEELAQKFRRELAK